MINSKYCKSWLKIFWEALYMQQPKVKTREFQTHKSTWESRSPGVIAAVAASLWQEACSADAY